MKRCVAIFLVILSALLLGLSTQSGALNGEFAWRPKVPMLSTDAPQTSEAPEKSTSGGSDEVGEMRAMRQILHEICRINQLPEARNHSFRDMPLHLREHLFTALFRAQQSLPLPALEQVSRPMLSPNCKHPKLSNLLTGKKRSTPLTLVDMASGMGGGPELEFLELRLLELQGVVDLMVVAESSHTFRGDLKPRQYQLNAERFKAFRDTVMYLDLEECEEYLHHINKTREKHGHHHDLWDIQNSQRGCLWKMLQRDRPNLTDDTIVIFSDLDEIPNGEMMMAMKHCEWKAQTPKIQFKQRMVQYNLRQVLSSPAGCFPKTAWLQGALLRLGWVRETVQKNQRIPLRFASPIATMDGGAMHLSYFGHAFALMTKGLQHGEGGALLLPTWFKPCDPTDQDILELLSIFRNDPVRIVRSWENKSNPLPKARPTLKDLQKCEVPWALQGGQGARELEEVQQSVSEPCRREPVTDGQTPKVFRGSREITEEISALTVEQLDYLDRAKWSEWQVDFGPPAVPQHSARAASATSSSSSEGDVQSDGSEPDGSQQELMPSPTAPPEPVRAARHSEDMSLAELNLKLASMARGLQRTAGRMPSQEIEGSDIQNWTRSPFQLLDGRRCGDQFMSRVASMLTIFLAIESSNGSCQ